MVSNACETDVSNCLARTLQSLGKLGNINKNVSEFVSKHFAFREAKFGLRNNVFEAGKRRNIIGNIIFQQQCLL